jgi:TRAP-type C4-dicarboxylate transport system permease small subunit
MAQTDISGVAKKFVTHVVPGVVRPLRVLWNEIIGFVFLAFGVMMIRPLWRGYQELDGDPASLIKFLVTCIFCLILLGFGIQSFWRARRIAKG